MSWSCTWVPCVSNMAAPRVAFQLQLKSSNLAFISRLLQHVCKQRSFMKIRCDRITTSYFVPFQLSYKNNLYCGGQRYYCEASSRELDEMTFHKLSEETLHNLMDHFEDLGDQGYFHDDFDVEYADGVLTIKFGGTNGTYVINKQTPNKQIWFSSPKSGPKRYDFIAKGDWIYRHDGLSLHELLSEEISELTGHKITFTNTQYNKETT